jgi:hypothetical protein
VVSVCATSASGFDDNDLRQVEPPQAQLQNFDFRLIENIFEKKSGIVAAFLVVFAMSSIESRLLQRLRNGLFQLSAFPLWVGCGRRSIFGP